MKNRSRVSRAVPAVAVFALVGVGVYAALPDDGNARDSALVPVVVATRMLPEGTSTDDVRKAVAVRMVPGDARADGAVTSPAGIPDGVLAYEHVDGQQILATSVAEDHVSSLGADYVAVSISLDTQRWAGPILQSGRRVEVWDTVESGPRMVADDAVVLDAPAPGGIEPGADTVVSIGVRRESVAAVLLAAANKRVWLVSR